VELGCAQQIGLAQGFARTCFAERGRAVDITVHEHLDRGHSGGVAASSTSAVSEAAAGDFATEFGSRLSTPRHAHLLITRAVIEGEDLHWQKRHACFVDAHTLLGWRFAWAQACAAASAQIRNSDPFSEPRDCPRSL
jgi:hypothetical protein